MYWNKCVEQWSCTKWSELYSSSVTFLQFHPHNPKRLPLAIHLLWHLNCLLRSEKQSLISPLLSCITERNVELCRIWFHKDQSWPKSTYELCTCAVYGQMKGDKNPWVHQGKFFWHFSKGQSLYVNTMLFIKKLFPLNI